VEAALADLRAQRSASRFGGAERAVQVPIRTLDEIADASAEVLVCRRLATIGDALAERNAGHRVMLPAEAEDLLRRHGIAA